MTTSELTLIPLRHLRVLPNNPRTVTQAKLNQLCDSIRENGFYAHRALAVEPIPGTPDYYVLDGNQRKKALARLKRKAAPCIIYTDLTEEERARLILMGNINVGEWDAQLLVSDFQPVVDFDAIGLEFEMPQFEADPVPTVTKDKATGSDGSGDAADSETPPDGDDTSQTDPEAEDRLSFYYRMMGDYLYPTDNEYQIPTLLSDRQPVHVELPLAPWGAEGRYKKGITTYHFYVDDYRFEQLFKNPILLLQSGCRAVVEPNVSIHDQTPVAIALYQIYRKRYLARYLQECGLQVWADLNVSPHLERWNALGIPQGYNAFFTRGVSGWQPTLDRHLEMARRISECDHPNLVVYGGGKDIADWCMAKQVVHIGEYMNRGRSDGKPEKG
jgi:hypothetical protein